MNRLEKLANKYEFDTVQELFNYIIDSHINGQKKQFNELMYEFQSEASYFEKQEVQICIINACNVFGLETTIKILKSYRYNYSSISDNVIINAFHDNGSNKLNEVKTVLLNLNDY